VPIANAGDPGVTRSELELTTTYIALLVGVRQVVAKGVVDVSVAATVGGGRTGIAGDRRRANETLSYYGLDAGDHTVALGVGFGISVERELIPALTLRLATDLLGASFTRMRDVSVDSDGVATADDHDAFAAEVALAPALELHFYF
jgi:hypothetical protein